MASTYLQNPSSGSSVSAERKTLTFSAWIKRSGLGSTQYLLTGINSSYYTTIYFTSSDNLSVYSYEGGTTRCNVTTTAVYRDTNAWYHIVVAIDTTQATANDRVKFYVNGVQETSITYSTNFPQNYNTYYGMTSGTDGYPTYLSSDSSSNFFNGLMADVYLVGGTAYTASTFGQTDAASGIWKPITSPSISWGTGVGGNVNLKFANSGSLGTDSSGSSNNWTVNGTGTQTLDTPSNVFATFNPLVKSSSATGATFSNGNTNVISSSGWLTAPATLGVSSGKWYWEVKCGTISGSNYIQAGVSSENAVFTNAGSYHESTAYCYAYHWDGQKYVNNVASSFGTAPSTGDIIMIALDCDNGFIYAGLNGTWQNSGDPTSGGSGTGALTTLASNQLWFPTVSAYSNTHNGNFGNGYFGTTAVASGNADGAGYGIFEYAPPTGYYALCTKNINTYG